MKPTNRLSSKRLPFNSPFFYGWLIVGMAAGINFFTGPGQTYSVSTFIDSYINEYGWSRSQVSSMYSTGTLLAGLLMGVVGGIYDRLGHRLTTALLAILFGFACIGMSYVNSVSMLFAGFFFIRLLGQGSLGLSGSTLVPQWFIKNRGKAFSLMALGGTISQALLPPLNIWLISIFGWRASWIFWGLILWVVTAPLAAVFIRNKPEDVGLRPDNLESSAYFDKPGDALTFEEAWTPKEALRTKTFWLLIFCTMVPSAIVTGLIFHQVSIMSRVGLSPGTAALIISIMAIVRLPVLLIAGPIADRVPPRYLLAGTLGMLLASIAVLYSMNSIYLAIIYALLLGVRMGIQGVVIGVIWPDYFGRRYISSIRGLTFMADVVGSAIGPLVFGVAYDMFGGYNQAMLISMIFPALGIAFAFLATKPSKRIMSNTTNV
jgi:MFS family permease